jgi:predicted ATPase/DNA-binding SARP family transcriptional activator
MEFRILGHLEVLEDGRRIDLGGAKQRALLAILLLHANEVVSTDRLIDALWEDEPPDTAQTALQVYVSQLRKVLGKERLETRAPGYRLQLAGAELDLARFEQLAEERPREALALWRGEPLAEFAYQRFAQAEIARLEELRLSCIERRLEEDLEQGRHAPVVGELEGLVRDHPLRERLRAQLMLALYRSGRQAEALETFQQTRKALVDGLGIEPSTELQELHRAILNQDPSLALAPTTALRLPAPANPLVGRREDLMALLDLLLSDVRLVTVTGAGGSGKTRLALEIAHLLMREFGKRVCFVSLAPLGEPELVATTILTALGGREVPGELTRQTLLRSLHRDDVLLVLDNFEHLLEAGPLVAELLVECPRLAVLVTSRASLHLVGEHEFPLEPLPLNHALRLFEERARAVNPSFIGDETVLSAICQRLDGLPLALELAAARSRLLNPDQLLQKLEHALSFLTRGPRDLAARQQTLRATMDWSHALAAPDERRVFARLAVFRGGCTLEAAAEVCSASFDQLESLLDQNLLRRRETGAEPRFWMLETIREYALDSLRADGTVEETRRAHAEYYIALAEEGVEAVERAEPTALARHERELDNFRSAFAWAEQNDPAAGLLLASALASYWYTSGQLAEGRRWFETVCAGQQPPTRELAVVTAELGRLLCSLGDSDVAEERVDDALELARTLELPDVLSEALNTKHLLLHNAGRSDEALGLLEQALAIARNENVTGAPFVRALYNLAYQMRARDRLVTSQAIDLEGLEASRKGGNKAYELAFLGHLLDTHVRLGQWDAALAIAADLENPSLPCGTFDSLGTRPWLHTQRGEVDRAATLLEEYAHLASADEMQARMIYSIGQAVVLRAEGKPREALAAAVSALDAQATLGPYDEVTLALVEVLEAAFDLDDFESAAQFLREWEEIRPLERPSFLDAQRARFGARLAAWRGDGRAVDPAFTEATDLFRALSMPFYVAVTLVEHGEWLVAQNRLEDALPRIAEADATFRRLQAKPWLERTASARPSSPIPTT